jgi:hypothetical protein
VILERVSLEKIGPFTTRVDVGPFDPGLTVIGGANEAGKSTLVRAVWAALFFKYSSKDEEVRALAPTGTKLGPYVEFAFSVGDRRYLLQKQFLVQRSALLQEWQNNAWTPLAEADEADRIVRTLWGLDSKSDSEKSLFTAFLWRRQGSPLQWPDWRRAQHGNALFSELDPLVAEAIEKLTAQEAETFSAKGKTVRARSELSRLEREKIAAETELQRIRARQSQFANDIVRLDRLRVDRVRLAEREKELVAKFEMLSQKGSRIRELKAELGLHEAQLREAQANLERVRHDRAVNETARTRSAQLVQTIAGLDQKIEHQQLLLKSPHSTNAEVAVREHQKQLDLARDQLRQLEARQQLVAARKEAAAVTIELWPDKPGSVTLRGDELREIVIDNPPASVHLEQTVEMILPGWGRLTIRPWDATRSSVTNPLGPEQQFEKAPEVLKVEIARLESDLQQATAEFEQHTRHEAGLKNELTESLRRRSNAETERQFHENRIAELGPIELLEKRLRDAQTGFLACEARRDQAKSLLPPETTETKAAFRQTKQELEIVRSRLKALEQELYSLEGRIAGQGGEGLYSEEAIREEHLESLSKQHHRHRLHAHATRFALELLRRQQTESVQTNLERLASKLTKTFARLTEVEGRALFLGPNAELGGIGIETSRSIPFDALSQGAKEQLMLALRAEVARNLSRDERQLLILDDVLVNTDATRQKRVIGFLQELAKQVQVVILTCHPEWYAGAGKFLKLG